MKKRLLSVLLVLALSLAVAVPSLAVEEDRGVLTYSELISPKYENARNFTNDLAAVEKNGKWGYIDTDGKTVIDFKYDYADRFSEGKAIVGKITGTFEGGYWDYDTETSYTVTYEEYQLGFIDRSGKETWFTIEDYDYDTGKTFDTPLVNCVMQGEELVLRNAYHQGYVVLNHSPKGEYWGSYLFDRNGKAVTLDTGDSGSVCGWWVTDDWVIIGYEIAYPAQYKFYNLKTGKILELPGTGSTDNTDFFAELRPFNQGIAPAALMTLDYDTFESTGLWGFINESGSWVIKGQYSDFMVQDLYGEYRVFGESGYACVADASGKWGVIDKTGKWIIPAQFETLYSFSSGLAACQMNGKYGFIDTAGQWVIPAQYVIATGFSDNGYAVAYDGENAFVIDRKGNVIEGSEKLDKDAYFYRVEGNDIPVAIKPGSIVVIEENGKYGYGEIEYLPELPEATDMSSWAYEEVVAAIREDLVPSYLQCLYRTDINRKEFCSLVVKTVEEITGKDINDYVRAKVGQDIYDVMAAYPFSDTVDYDVIAANALGIVSGRGNGEFDPYARITRQEAAVMLTNAALALDLDVSDAPAVTFTDSGKMGSWAVDAVNYVYSIGVMNGVGDNGFAPLGSYTREQSYLTIYRIFEAALAE